MHFRVKSFHFRRPKISRPGLFHLYEEAMQDLVKRSVDRMKSNHDILEFKTILRLIPWVNVMIIILSFFLGISVVPTGTFDFGDWTGTLSTDATVTLGLLAILSYVIRPFIRQFPAFFDGAVARGFLKAPSLTDGHTIQDMVIDELKKNPEEETSTLVQFARKGIYCLIGIVIVLPFGFIMSTRMQLGFVFAISATSALVIIDYAFFAWNSMGKLSWDLYDAIKREHDKDIAKCHICQYKLAISQQEVAVSVERSDDISPDLDKPQLEEDKDAKH